MNNLKVGMSGWHRLEGFYPPRTRQPAMLPYYATQFSFVEVTTTFQGIPNPERVREWAASVPAGFSFDVLAFGGLTLHQRRPGDAATTVNRSWTEVAVEPPPVLFEDFDAAIAPLRDAGHLGLVILQFPPWFESGPAGFDYLSRCREHLRAYRLGAEFRHSSWLQPAARLESTLDRLIDLEIALTVSDFPSDAKEAPAPCGQVTFADIVPVRLHGRAKESWPKLAADGAFVAEYPYSESDLAELARIVQAVGKDADEVHVAFDVLPSAGAVEAARRLVDVIETAEREPDYSNWRRPGIR